MMNDDQYAQGVGEGDLPMDGGKAVLTTQSETPKEKKSRRKFFILFIIIIVLLLAVIIGLAVGLAQNRNRDIFQGIGENPEEGGIGGTPGTGTGSGTTTTIDDKPTNTKDPSTLEEEILEFLKASGIDETKAKTEDTPHNQAMKFMETLAVTLDVPPSSDSEIGYKYLTTYIMSLLYYSTGGASSWLNGLGFLGDADVCTWKRTFILSDTTKGASCTNGQVTDIDLQINGLKGTVPTELGLLTRLERLTLRVNEMTGTIPTELANIPPLKLLSFEFNQMTGSIPSQLITLTNLFGFIFGQNQLTGDIPTDFSKLTKLEVLSLDDNLMTGDLSELHSLPALRYVWLEDNEFTDTLDSNFLAGSRNSMVIVDISDNNIDGQLSQDMFDLENGIIMDLHGNKLTGNLPEFPANENLRFLALHSNSFNGDVPESISNLKALTHLDLAQNSLQGLPDSLGDLSELEYLFVAANNFPPGPVFPFLERLTKLSDLSLKATDRTGAIPTWFGNLDGLFYLDLDSNALNGQIPTELADMQSLRFLLLQRNKLTGDIPEVFGDLTAFNYLDFENNTLSGNLTASVCNVKNALPFESYVIADCDGDSPEVECECCDVCCNDNDSDSCNDYDRFGQLDPVWYTGYTRDSFYDLGTDHNIVD